MTNAIRFHQTGGPDVLRWEPVSLSAPGPGEVTVRQRAVGLNFVDVYHRTGLYPVTLPSGLGQEGAGTVVAVGPDVSTLSVGDRVAYVGLIGAYAEERNVPADRMVKLPDEVDDVSAAAMMLKGLTAEYLLRRTHGVHPGSTIVFHAVAGGVGSIACPWAKSLGMTVIGVVGSPAKRDVAVKLGCDHVFTNADFVAGVKEVTQGKGADVVFDSVGKDTVSGSLECLRPRGILVSFGQSSGKVPPFDLVSIGGLRSLYVTRPSLFAYVATRAELTEAADALFDVVKKKIVALPAPRTFPLRDAAEAHRALEARETTGSVVLLP
jgi:NADPH2:quinone reductase